MFLNQSLYNQSKEMYNFHLKGYSSVLVLHFHEAGELTRDRFERERSK